MISSMRCLRKELLLQLAWNNIKKDFFIIFKLMITHEMAINIHLIKTIHGPYSKVWLNLPKKSDYVFISENDNR